MDWSQQAEAALARNMRFLTDVVEGLNICPYARRSRLDNTVLRLVFDDPVSDGVLACHDELAAVLDKVSDQANHEVTQLIFPRATCDPQTWVRVVKRATAELQAARGRSTVGVAAFHPDLAFGTDRPETLVPLFRRAPDPTIQWIRLDALDRVRRSRPHGDVAIAHGPDLWKSLEKLRQPSIADEIAQHNYDRVESMGLDAFVALLTTLRA